MAECCVIGCKRQGSNKYSLGGDEGVKFNYCDKHENIPKKQIKTVNKVSCQVNVT